MNSPLPEWITFLFLGSVAWGMTALLIALRIVADSPRAALASRVVVFTWLGVPALLAFSGILAEFDAVPPMLLRVLAPIALIGIVFIFSPIGRNVAHALPLTLLIGFQAFRVPVEIVLHALYTHELVPRAMTFVGYNFDIVTGISAFGVWLLLRGNQLPRGVILAWNTFGLTTLVTIVIIAILSFPKPFGLFVPHNRIMAYFPWAWLPTFLVPLALFGHLLVYRRLLTAPRQASATK